jgi:hypothetical protein
LEAFDDLVRHALDLFLDLAELAAHETLDGINRIAGVGHGLTFGRVAHETLAALREGHDRRGDAASFRISNTTGSPPSMTAMQELVVPKSMPNTFAIKSLVTLSPLNF